MIDRGTWRQAWTLLDAREKRSGFVVLLIVTFAALVSAAMVASIMPMLTVLAEPKLIRTNGTLDWAYRTFGFQSDFGFIVGLGLASFAMILFSALVQIAKTYVIWRYSLMRMHTISKKLLRAYLGRPYEFFLNRHSGDMATKVLAESREVVLQFFKPVAELVAAIATVIAIVALLLALEPLITIAVIAVLGGLYGLVFVAVRTIVSGFGKRRVEANQGRFRAATEALAGVKIIKLLGREAGYVERYSRSSLVQARSEVAVHTISNVPQHVLQAVALGGIIALSLLLVQREGVGSEGLAAIVPTLGLFGLAGQRLLPELSLIYTSLTRIKAGEASVQAVHDDLPSVSQAAAAAHIEPLPLKQDLVLTGLGYSYPEAGEPSLADINIAVRAGERIGIVGGTGAGKTTLADLVLGLLTSSTGSISIDGVELDNVDIRRWQRNIGYVPQDIFLTDSTIAENIALGVENEAIDRARVELAARTAQIDDFIRDELPNGYDTMVGDRGVRLSGGQRQRIGIARALYRDSDLIVFDEATSALDNVTEVNAMEAIRALPGAKTLLIIAHRLSTVKECDRIVVLEQGRIVGIGPWDELVTSNAAFKNFADKT